MLKKVIAFFFLLLLVTGIAFTETTLYSGDDKIDEIQKRIDEEKKRQEKEKDDGRNDWGDDGEGRQLLIGFIRYLSGGLVQWRFLFRPTVYGSRLWGMRIQPARLSA